MRTDQLKRFALLAQMDHDDREALSDLLEERKLSNGKSAFREGAESEGLLLLAEGRLKLKSRRTGEIVGVLEAPDHLGASSLFAFGKREVTALAEGPCTVWLLPRGGLPRLMEDAPRTAFRLAEAVAAELSSLLRQAIDVVSESDLR